MKPNFFKQTANLAFVHMSRLLSVYEQMPVCAMEEKSIFYGGVKSNFLRSAYAATKCFKLKMRKCKISPNIKTGNKPQGRKRKVRSV